MTNFIVKFYYIILPQPQPAFGCGLYAFLSLLKKELGRLIWNDVNDHTTTTGMLNDLYLSIYNVNIIW